MSGRPGPEDLLGIGEVVARSGVPASALHFYEREGLIDAERGPGNHRLYRRHMLRRISLILIAKRIGIPLSEVAEIFRSLPDEEAPTPDQWTHVSRQWRRRLETQRLTIEALERELIGCIGCGCLSMKACQLLNPGDDLSERGTGPVRLELARVPSRTPGDAAAAQASSWEGTA